MPSDLCWNHFTFDVARIQQGGDPGICRHRLRQDQLAAARISQGTYGLASGRTKIIEVIVERCSQRRSPMNAAPTPPPPPPERRACVPTDLRQADSPDRVRSGPPPPRH